ncbi:right-handed parallel beta-helix repeat-containing protein [Actinospica sp. MGRD01-02]|uniref:Right-handed parallel beta-helix repeat-containing protein n=1 Tax=Actinospica acidithermotolerans TaxID=2828514 RepID=A0A941E253_9ACTN|nr:right-handed parallel beta-helix repeat-containing protein [Actinospica acidithermotolerans]MBR7824720.1 right-handed parallel beta-helix repeat-containing protein [Actinospica acidithermotolerans]
MRPRVVAVSAATLLAAASVAPGTAQAAGQNALYVNGGSSACTDSGPGTLAAPFCSIQAAADVANPGDVVVISGGTYASGVTITRSGTASAPIVFTGAARVTTIGEGSTASSEFTLSGASYVEIENLEIYSGSSAAVTVNGGADDTFAKDVFTSVAGPNTGGPTALHVTGGASGVTLQDSTVYDGIAVDGGSTGTVVTTNVVEGADSTPISVQGAKNTAITSNTVEGCSPGIAVTGSSAGTSIENNVVTVLEDSRCPAASAQYGVQVDASSAAGTTLDYNDVYGGSSGTAYSWGGTAYPTAAGLFSAVAQGKHDYNGADGGELAEGSPVINSADSAAIGEQPFDVNGDPRVIDPLVTPTGAGPYNYYDRGATQFQDPYTATANSSYTLSATKIPLGATVTAHAVLADTWGDSFTSYEFLFGGSAQPVVSSTPTETFTPTTATTYWTAVLAATAGSSTYHQLSGVADQYVSVVAPQPLVAAEALTASGELGVIATDYGTTDAWNISSATFDFGDGTKPETVADLAQAQHTYAKPGTYTITETVTDAGGNSATTSSKFATAEPQPGTLGSVVNGGGVPAGSTGIAQAAIGGAGSGAEILAATTSGQAEFSSSDFNAVWQPWQTLSQPGVTVKWVGLAGMPNGSTQLIEVTSAGRLLHTIRNANGTWQSSGWGSPAGSTGFAHAAITAMPDGSAQLVAVTTSGVLMHNIRFANGSWQGWRALSQPGTTIIDASIAGKPDGSSQIVEVTSGRVMKHTIRFSNGSWQKQGWGSPAGATDIVQASIATVGAGSTAIAVTKADGTGETTYRNWDGSWTGWQQADISPAPSITDFEAGWVPNENVLFIAVSGG